MKRWLVVLSVSLCLAVGVGTQAFAQTAAEKIKAAKMREAQDDMKEAFLLAGNGQDAEAVKYFRAAVGLRPDWAEAHSLLGSALARAGNYKEAETELRKAVALKPDYAEGWNFLGEFLKSQGKDQEAQEAFRKAQQYAH
jgi:Flp pilus assembly protein TadD